MLVNFAIMLTTKDISIFDEVLESYDPERIQRQENIEAQKLFCYQNFFIESLNLLKKCNVRINQTYLFLNRNYYLSLILDKLDIEKVQKAINSQNIADLPVDYETVKQIVKLKKYFTEYLKPVHQTVI